MLRYPIKTLFCISKEWQEKKKGHLRLVISPEGGWSENLKVLFQIPDYKFALNSSKPKTTKKPQQQPQKIQQTQSTQKTHND